MEEKWYAEYSVVQDCFHIDNLEQIIKNNISLCLRGVSNGYVIIGGPFTMEVASEYCDTIKQKMVKATAGKVGT